MDCYLQLEQNRLDNKFDYYIEVDASIKTISFASGSVAVPTGDGLLFIKTQNIIRCEADGNYVIIYQPGKEKMLITKNLGDVESMLDAKEFFRIHNSHLINLSHIKKYVKGEGGYVIMSDNSTVDVARRKKEEFMQMLNIR